jgi:TP901 family phage tail tape measure protein
LASTNLRINFQATANVNPLIGSLRRLNAAVNKNMQAMTLGAATVEDPLTNVTNKINAGRMSLKELSFAYKNQAKLLTRHNQLMAAQAVTYKDADGNARVFLRQMYNMEASTIRFTQRLAFSVGLMRSFSRNLITMGKNIQWAGRQVMVGLTLPMLALGKAASDSAEEFNRQMTRVVKVYDLSSVRMQRAGQGMVQVYDVANREGMRFARESIERQVNALADLGASMGFAAEETAKLVATFAQMGFSGAALSGITEAAMTLSRVSGAELSESVDLTRLAFQTFNKDLGDGPGSVIETFARLNLIENRTSLSLDEMAGSIPIVAAVAKNLGIEMERLAGFIAIMKDQGIAAREGATSLRTGLIRLVQDATDPAQEAFQRLGIDIRAIQERNLGDTMGTLNELAHLLYDIQNNAADSSAQTDLFIAAIGKMVGTRAASRFTALLEGMGNSIVKAADGTYEFIEGIDQNSQAFRALSPIIEDGNRAILQFRYEQDMVNESLAGQAEILRAQLGRELQKLGERLLPLKNMVMDFALSILRAINNMSEFQRKILGFGLAVPAILGPLTMIAGVILNVIGQMGTLISAVVSKFLPSLKLLNVQLAAEQKANWDTTLSLEANQNATVGATTANQTFATSIAGVTSALNAQTAAAAQNLAATQALAGGGGQGPRSGRTGRFFRSRMVGGGMIIPTALMAGGRSVATAGGGTKMGLPYGTPRAGDMNLRQARGGISLRQGFKAGISRENLLSMLPMADVERVTARGAGGRSMISRLELVLASMMEKEYAELRKAEQAQVVADRAAGRPTRRMTSMAQFQRSFMNQSNIERAVMNLASTGGKGAGVGGGALGTALPMLTREMFGMGQRLPDQDTYRLSREQRSYIRDRFGLKLGGRVTGGSLIGDYDKDPAMARTFAEVRRYLDKEAESGRVGVSRKAMTGRGLLAEVRGLVTAQIDNEIESGILSPDAAGARRAELLGERGLDIPQGGRAERRYRRRAAFGRVRDALAGRDLDPRTQTTKGIRAGRKAASLLSVPKLIKATITAPFKAVKVASGLLIDGFDYVISNFSTIVESMKKAAVAIWAAGGNIAAGIKSRVVSAGQFVGGKYTAAKNAVSALRGRMSAVGIPTSIRGMAGRARDVLLRRPTAGRMMSRQMATLRGALGGAPMQTPMQGFKSGLSNFFKSFGGSLAEATKAVKTFAIATMVSAKDAISRGGIGNIYRKGRGKLASKLGVTRGMSKGAMFKNAGKSILKGGLRAIPGLGQFAGGSALGFASSATVAIPIVLALGGMAIANPEQFMAKLKETIAGPLETAKKVIDSIVRPFKSIIVLFKTASKSSSDMGKKLAGFSGALTGFIGGSFLSLFNVIGGAIAFIMEGFEAFIRLLQGDSVGATETLRLAWLRFRGVFAESLIFFLQQIKKIPLLGDMKWVDRSIASLERFAARVERTLAPMDDMKDAINDAQDAINDAEKAVKDMNEAFEEAEEIRENLIEYGIMEEEQFERIAAAYASGGATFEERIKAAMDEAQKLTNLTDEQRDIMVKLAAMEELRGSIQAQNATLQSLQNEMMEDQAVLSEVSARYAVAERLARQGNIADANIVMNSARARAESIKTAAEWEAQIEALNRGIVRDTERLAELEQEIAEQRTYGTQQRQIAADLAAAEREAEEEAKREEAERQNERMQALKSATSEVLGFIDQALKKTISSQEKMISEYFAGVSDAASKYFKDYVDQLKEQTDAIKNEIKSKYETEREQIEENAELALSAIEAQEKEEEKLDDLRKRHFENEKARLEYTKDLEVGRLRIEQAMLRGDSTEVAILRIEQQFLEESYFAELAERRAQELEDMRKQQREEQKQAIKDEKDAALEESKINEDAAISKVDNAQMTLEQAAAAAQAEADEKIALATSAANAAREAEEQRIENYLRDWQRVTPATEAEYRQHVAKLEKFMDQSSSRLQAEINAINSSLRAELDEISGRFGEVNSAVIADIQSSAELANAELSSLSNSMYMNSVATLTSILGSITGFVDGLNTGFATAHNLSVTFLKTFESNMKNGFATARDIAAAELAEAGKWENVGKAIQAAIQRGLSQNGDYEGGSGSGSTPQGTTFTGFQTVTLPPDFADQIKNYDWGQIDRMMRGGTRSNTGITYMAKGGIVTRPTYPIMAGEAGPEAIIPLKNIGDVVARINAAQYSTRSGSGTLKNASGSYGGNYSNEYHLSFNVNGGNIDEQKLAQKVVFEIKRMERASGMGRRV